MTGTVKSYGRMNGYGFIETNDGEIFFFHHTEWHLPIKPQARLIVEFDPVETSKGWQARNIQRGKRKEK